MVEPLIHDGGCLCGAVRYHVDGPIDSVAHCHCRMCRRASGAPVVTWLTVPLVRFAITRGNPEVYASSKHAERQFCATCGTQLTFWTRRAPDDIDVTLNSLDYPEHHPADRHVWSSSRLPWLRLDEHLPAHAQHTPRED